MANKMPFDEINALETYLRRVQTEQGTIKKLDPKDVSDSLLDILIISYMAGTAQANESKGAKGTYTPKVADMESSLYKQYDGKNFADRVADYIFADDVESIVRVIETDTHRVYNDGAITAAKGLGLKTKTWQTMMDDRVRDPHWVLQGVTVGENEEFFVDGASTQYPGGFGVPELDISCRCWLEFDK